MFIHFGSDPSLQSKLRTLQAFTPQSAWFHFVGLLVPNSSGVTEEHTGSARSKSEEQKHSKEQSETGKNAFFLHVQGWAGVVGVMAFATNTPF